MGAIALDWIQPLTVLTITGFSFALIAYVWFFRHIQIRTNIVGSVFFVPLIATTYGFIFPQGPPTSHVIALGEIAMVLLLLCFGSLMHYKLRLESALFVSILTGGCICLALSALKSLPFLYQDLRVYLMISFIATFALVIVSKRTDEARLTGNFAFLGIAQLVGLFETVPMAAVVSLALKTYFYFQVTKHLYSTIHDEVMKEVEDARRIQKDFDDELRKEVKKQLFYMEISNQKMAKISQSDPLTGVFNRKGIMNEMERLVDDRNVKQFSMLIFDIDRFKNINDTMGHPVGDKCIQTLCNIGRSNLRDGDSLGRYGGDEFIILLAEADAESAYKVAERFRQRVQETQDPHFTVSIGLAAYPMDGRNCRELLEHADAGLYLSKNQGRNKVSRKEATPSG